MTTVNRYPEFDIQPTVTPVIDVLDFFTILLNDGSIVHFTAKDANSFRH